MVFNLDFKTGILAGLLLSFVISFISSSLFTSDKDKLRQELENVKSEYNRVIEVNKNMVENYNKLELDYKKNLEVQAKYHEALSSKNKEYDKLTNDYKKKLNDVVKNKSLNRTKIKIEGLNEEEARKVSKVNIETLHQTYNLYNK